MRSRSQSILVVVLALSCAAAPLGCKGSLASGTESRGPRTGQGGLLPSGVSPRVELRRERDPTGMVVGRFEASVSGDLRGVVLKLPDDSLLPLDARADASGPTFGSSFVGTEADVRRRFPTGLYFFELTLVDGSNRSFGTFVSGDFPPFPQLLEPADGATGVALLALFRLRGEGDRFDIVVRPAASTVGPPVPIVEGTREREARASMGVLLPRTEYLVELRARQGPDTQRFVFVSAVSSRFTTAD